MLYRNTYDSDWIKNCLSGYVQSRNTNIDLISLRQSLIDKICHNNDLMDWYKKSLAKQLEINTFLQKIYFFINFNL